MSTKKTAALLIGHGSSVKGANDAMFQIMEIIRKKDEFAIVEGAFLELSPPLIPEGIEECIRQGADEILVAPYFLHQGRHIRSHIPQILKEEARKHPDVAIRLGDAMNFHPLLAEVMADRIRETRNAEEIRATEVSERNETSAPQALQ